MEGDDDLNLLRYLPYHSLSDFQLEMEYEPCRVKLKNLLDDAQFHDLMTNVDENYNPENCKYYDSDEYNFMTRKSTYMKIFHLNIRMLARNGMKLQAYLSLFHQRFDVIILSEIGKEGFRYLHNTLPDYLFIYDLPTRNKYGGVAMFVHRDFGELKERHDLKIIQSCNCDDCGFENVWGELKLGREKIILGGIYRHPKGKVQHFVDDMEATLKQLEANITYVIIGDTNINLLNYENLHTSDYLTQRLAYNFIPKITLPTRIKDTSMTLIDHIFLRVPKTDIDKPVYCGNLYSETTDHLPNFIVWPCEKLFKLQRPLIRIYSEKNIKKFTAALSSENWDFLTNTTLSVDDIYELFSETFLRLFHSCFPLTKQSRKRSKDKRWITPGLKISIKHKDRLYRKKLNNPTDSNILKYKDYKNKLDSCLKKAMEIYYCEIFSEKSNSVLQMWKSLGHIFNPSKKAKQNHIDKIIYENREINDKQEIADAMNEYFCTIGEKLASNLEGNNFQKYMTQRINDSFFLSPTSEHEIKVELKILNPRKSAGADMISPKILKYCCDNISYPLMYIFNKSMEDATYPSHMKIAKILALFKKNLIHMPENYRPISLLSSLDKIFEKIIYKRLSYFIEKHAILYLQQYGFRKKHSTTLALIDLTDKIRTILDGKQYALGIYLDLKKAFDTVDHGILLSKLETYGFRGHVNDFIRSYLSNRKQFTIINGYCSSQRGINVGVPQGSVLGPLFSCFI